MDIVSGSVEPGAITLDIKGAIGKVGYLYQPDPSSGTS